MARNPKPDALNWVYCIIEEGSELTGPCKVGVTVQLSSRLSSIQAGNFRPLRYAWALPVPDGRQQAMDIEQHCLIRYRPNPYTPTDEPRLKSEWIDSAPVDALRVALEFLAAGEAVSRESIQLHIAEPQNLHKWLNGGALHG